jgi:hypothetical protein
MTHTHTTTHTHSVRFLWTRDRPITETSTWQHTKFTKDRHSCPGGIRTRNPSKRAAADLHLRWRGHEGRPTPFHALQYATKVYITMSKPALNVWGMYTEIRRYETFAGSTPTDTRNDIERTMKRRYLPTVGRRSRNW